MGFTYKDLNNIENASPYIRYLLGYISECIETEKDMSNDEKVLNRYHLLNDDNRLFVFRVMLELALLQQIETEEEYQDQTLGKMRLKNNVDDGKPRCSFCGKSNDAVYKLISGPSKTYICDECVSICSELLKEETEEDE